MHTFDTVESGSFGIDGTTPKLFNYLPGVLDGSGLIVQTLVGMASYSMTAGLLTTEYPTLLSIPYRLKLPSPPRAMMAEGAGIGYTRRISVASRRVCEGVCTFPTCFCKGMSLLAWRPTGRRNQELLTMRSGEHTMPKLHEDPSSNVMNTFYNLASDVSGRCAQNKHPEKEPTGFQASVCSSLQMPAAYGQ